jgi:hypothetical protein
VRLLVIVALASACGGSPAASTTSTPTQRAETEEDWRGFLSQIAGTPCQWIPGASFLACIAPTGDPTTTLIGWEANNRRYVAWRIDTDGAVSILPGAGGNEGWQFEGPDGRIELTRTASGWDATGLAAATVPVLGDPAAQPPAPAPNPASTENWRNALEGFTATWAFNGTPSPTQIHCMWIATASFMVCKTIGGDGFDLIGWEPHNARYVMYRFTPSAVDVLLATRDGRHWTFASKTHRVRFGYESPIRRTLKDEALVAGSWQIVADGTLETSID